MPKAPELTLLWPWEPITTAGDVHGFTAERPDGTIIMIRESIYMEGKYTLYDGEKDIRGLTLEAAVRRGNKLLEAK